MTALPPDPDFAAMIESLAISALAEHDYELADYLFDAADQWETPSESVLTLRVMSLNAALNLRAARERAT